MSDDEPATSDDAARAAPGWRRLASRAWLAHRGAGRSAAALRARDRRCARAGELRSATAGADAAPAGIRQRRARAPAERRGTGEPPPSLRERGAELLRRSADVDYDEDAHPAYERILDELAPDEARILRLLATEGPQPAVDVRTGAAARHRLRAGRARA